MAARFAKSQVDMHTAIAANDQSVMGAHVAAPAGAAIDYNARCQTFLSAATFDLDSAPDVPRPAPSLPGPYRIDQSAAA